MLYKRDTNGRAVIYGYDYKRKEKLDVLIAILQERLDESLELQLEIENWINSINKSDLKQIFEFRYIENMSWIQIQIMMGYKSENTARMKHNRFLEKN